MGCEEFNLNSNIQAMKEKTKIMFNGNWIGFAENPEKVIGFLKKARDSGKIS